MRKVNYKRLKCKLKLRNWIDEYVECDINIMISNYRKKWSGLIRTSKPLPIDNIVSYYSNKETFEMWFYKSIANTEGLKIKLSNIDTETKKNANFESWGILQKKQ